MDFPLQLIPNPAEANNPAASKPGIGSNLEFVYGMDELRNDLYLLFKQYYGTFLQSPEIGTPVAPHQLLDEYLESSVRRTVEQLNGCSCEGVERVNDYLLVRVRYRDNITDFTYSIASLE